MNQGMPEWRSFSSDPTARPQTQEASDTDAETRSADVPAARPRASLAAVTLGVLGSVLLGTALLGLAALLLTTSDHGDISVGTSLAGPGLSAPAANDAGSVGADTTALVVDVAGAVVRPGLHRLAAGARVGDAIEAAGGYAPSADLAAAGISLNLAHPLEDGAKVLVPALGMATEPAGGDGDGRIDLNRAGHSELETLPGIGPVTAARIVDARAQRRFATVRDLRARDVVGQAVFDDIKDLVRVGA